MRHLVLLFAIASTAVAQTNSDAFGRAAQVLEWRVAVPRQGDASTDGVPAVEITSAQLAPNATQPAIDALRSALQARQLVALIYRVEGDLKDNAAWMQAIATASKLGARVIVGAPPAEQLDTLAKTAADNSVTLALDASSGALLDPERALAAVRKYEKRVRIWADPAAWEKAGTRPLAAIYMLREHLAGATLSAGQGSDEFVREAYRLDIKPLVWTVPATNVKQTANTIDALVSYHQNYASRTPGVRRLGGITPEERAKVEAAVPATAPATPRKPRKLLVFDLNVGRFGHPSIPYANLAMELMGTKTGAFEATVSSDPAMLHPARLKAFDAVYLNNTIGDIFSTAEARDGFASFVANGGGLIGNHATTVTATEWAEFGNILGARGASHRMTDEKVVINVEDPKHPIVKAFGAGPFEYADEIFRFQPPYSRDKVRVLLSVDPLKTDMNQGRCFGQCYRDDNDYPIAWIQQYGKGRVFYTTLGHNPHVFWQPNMLQMFLAAVQYALGDLEADATPLDKVSELDRVLTEVASYDFGEDEGPVRRLDRAMGTLGPKPDAARNAEQKLLGVLKSSPKPGAIDVVTRHLATVGTAASVPALSPLLANTKTADMARYALERIESADAVAAMRDAMSRASDARVQTGLIHTLARRRDAESVPVLKKLITSSDLAVAAAAVNGLGMIGTPEAEQALFTSTITPAIADALLTLAEQSPAARASSIYSRLMASSKIDEIRVAAVQGLARHNDIAAVAKALEDSSPNVQTAAVVNLARPAPATLIPAIGKLPPAAQIQALNALTLHEDKGARGAILAAAKSKDAAVRVAALQTLAEVGSAEDIPLLIAGASGSNAAEHTAARFVLTRLPGAEIDAAIVAAVPSAAGKSRIELIRATGERGIASAQDMLLAAVQDKDPAVRRESWRALRGIVRPEKTQALLDLLLNSADDDREESERVLAAAIGRSEKPDLKPVTEAFGRAQDSGVRASLLSVMALTGEKSALPTLTEALETKDAEVQRAAVAGLSQWGSPEPMRDLLRVARTSSDPSLKVLALRGYIRLVQRPAGRTQSETAKLLGEAMAVASRPDEKKAVLAAVQRVITPESLKIAQSAVQDPAIAAEAELAVSTLERALRERGR